MAPGTGPTGKLNSYLSTMRVQCPLLDLPTKGSAAEVGVGLGAVGEASFSLAVVPTGSMRQVKQLLNRTPPFFSVVVLVSQSSKIVASCVLHMS